MGPANRTAGPDAHGTSSPGGRAPRVPRRALVLAFAVAAVSDALSILLAPAPPLQWAVDGVTAMALFLILGRQWALLPGLVMEAIPGLYILPFWVLVVGAVGMWGTARPGAGGGIFEPRLDRDRNIGKAESVPQVGSNGPPLPPTDPHTQHSHRGSPKADP